MTKEQVKMAAKLVHQVGAEVCGYFGCEEDVTIVVLYDCEQLHFHHFDDVMLWAN